MKKVEMAQRIAAAMAITKGQADAAVEAILTAVKDAYAKGKPSRSAASAPGRSAPSGHASAATRRPGLLRRFPPAGWSASPQARS